MRTLFDVNALLALVDPDHVSHGRIRGWWSANQADGWATCPLTQNGFARVMSQRSYPQHRPLSDALEALRLGVMQPDHMFWADDVSITDPTIFDHARILGPNQITDVYLLALAVKNGGRLVTFDRGIPISAAHGAEARHLVVI
ncbi:MAG: TA system VapC family ribonuclease toxin [Propylenella sp.]